MKDIIISVESTADLTPELLKQYDIKSIPMVFYVDDVEYGSVDKNMTTETFYNKMKAGSKTSTSQVNQYMAREFFENLLKEGKDILHLSFSSALSGTCSVAKAVAEELNKTHENQIKVIDSLSAAAGQGLYAIILAQKKKEVESIDELVNYAESIKQQICHLFVVDSLKYLARTGRVSKATALIGSALQIKPVLHCDSEGHLTSMAKVISRKKSIKALADKMAERKNDISDIVFIAHANCLDDAQILHGLVKEKTNIDAQIIDLGCVIGCHAGPGTLALFFTGKER